MSRVAKPAPTPSPRPHRVRRGEGERLREEILAAATRLLVSTGDESAVSIRAVAKEVGVTPPSIYLHFADKAELLWAICQELFRQLDEHIATAMAGCDDSIESLKRCGRAYIQFGLRNAEAYRILFMTAGRNKPELPDPQEIAEMTAFHHPVERVQRGMETGALRPGDPVLAALGLWSTAHGITSLLISLPAFPWPQDRDQMIDRILDQSITGLAAR